MFGSLGRLFQTRAEIPVFVPCFNAVSYARGMVDQLRERGCGSITLIDNASTYPPMVEYLASPGPDVSVVRLGANKGPCHIFQDRSFYASLPKLFCLTDPDLAFNERMPSDFLRQLAALTEERKVGKVGLALDISEPDTMRFDDFLIEGKGYKIWEWESQFWNDRVQDTPEGDPVYQALVDTTFAVYNKKYFDPTNYFQALRVAGRFTCRHLPWYKDIGMAREEEEYYRAAAKTSYYLRGDESAVG